MDIDNYIYQGIFEQKQEHRCFYELLWENLKEDGYVVTDEPDNEIDSIFKAVALQNLLGEFTYRMYDDVNETCGDDVIEYVANVGIGEDEIIDYCYSDENIDTFDDDNELTIKSALDYITEMTAEKLLELFSCYDLFNYFFCATYAFEQDFTFAFEDMDEFQAFVDSNDEKLDGYKDMYPNVLQWIKSGMIV